MDTMPQIQVLKEHVGYRFHDEHKIHEYVLYRVGRNVVDEWFDHLDEIVRLSIETQEEKLLFLMDLTQGGQRQSFGYSIAKAKDLANKYPDAPPRHYAALGTSSALGAILKPGFNLLRLKFQYFVEGHEQDAIEWLINS